MIRFLSVLSAQSAVAVSKKSAPSCHVVAFAETDDHSARHFRLGKESPSALRGTISAFLSAKFYKNCDKSGSLGEMVFDQGIGHAKGVEALREEVASLSFAGLWLILEL